MLKQKYNFNYNTLLFHSAPLVGLTVPGHGQGWNPDRPLATPLDDLNGSTQWNANVTWGV
jgi:hypothetical protein